MEEVGAGKCAGVGRRGGERREGDRWMGRAKRNGRDRWKGDLQDLPDWDQTVATSSLKLPRTLLDLRMLRLWRTWRAERGRGREAGVGGGRVRVAVGGRWPASTHGQVVEEKKTKVNIRCVTDQILARFSVITL